MRKRELLAMIQSLEAVVDELTARLDAHESWATKFDATSDTVRIPADRIAESNAESSFIGGLDRAPTNSPNDMRVVIETKDTPDGFTMNVRTHERGTGFPILSESDESKRIAEAVANTPHSC